VNKTNTLGKVNRRSFLASSSAGLLLPAPRRADSGRRNPFERVRTHPDSVLAFAESGALELVREKQNWHSGSVVVETPGAAGTGEITLQSPEESILRIRLRWRFPVPENLSFTGDAWERSYGDLAWRNLEPERILPWYFLATDRVLTAGCGVRTGAAALAFWQVDSSGVSLWLDVRNGGSGVKLGDRKLALASVTTASAEGISAFAAAQQFCRELCPSPRLPKAPVYGGNNWYYAYGHSSAAEILADSERMASLASSRENRPFMVIDDGWEPNPTAGPWSTGNSKFPDMADLAARMTRAGVQPGLWYRPLFTKEQVPGNWRLTHPNAAREFTRHSAYTLDPTVPEVAAKIRETVSQFTKWGYNLLKHDFSTYDLFGRWGFTMGAEITDSDWHFDDETRTNAEIVGDLYRTIRESAGDALILGCNTIGHIAAGLFELQRTGDDTSGRDWNRTRKMGVNTLAFRACQNDTFFAIDADCVGLTKQVPWQWNRQWLELLAFSGTPLFVSAAPDALGTEQREALRRAFSIAAKKRSTAEPLDWLRNTEPTRWRNGGETKKFDWFGENGASPFSR
jgi:alpha-galactosidase